MELWTERALAQDVSVRPAAPEHLLVLSQADFTDAVRQALRDLHRPELLARNPLLRTRLAHDYAGADEPDAEALRGLLRAAVESLRQHPRDDKLLRAVERTYLRPAPTQEARRRAARGAVQHLPAPPLPGRGAHRRLALGSGAVRRRRPSTAEHR